MSCGTCAVQGQGADLSQSSLVGLFHNEKCAWCVKEAQCQRLSGERFILVHLTKYGTCKEKIQKRIHRLLWNTQSSNCWSVFQSGNCSHFDDAFFELELFIICPRGDKMCILFYITQFLGECATALTALTQDWRGGGARTARGPLRCTGADSRTTPPVCISSSTDTPPTGTSRMRYGHAPMLFLLVQCFVDVCACAMQPRAVLFHFSC